MRPIVAISIAGSAWAGGNLPPIPAVAANPDEALVRQTVSFSSAGTVDPDGGPGPLTYLWSFGDGATSTDPNPTHAYAAFGAHAATLAVSDGADGAIAGVSVFVLDPPAPAAGSGSAPLALMPDEAEVWVANQDSNTVTILDTGTGEIVAEVEVGRTPRTLALAPDGALAYVACQDSDEVWVLATAQRRVVATVGIGRAPYGVACAPDGTVLVTELGAGTVRVLAPGAEAELAAIGVGPEPRAIAIAPDGGRAYVTHFLTRGEAGTVTVLDLEARAVMTTVALVEDAGPDTPSSGRGVPNLLGAAAVHPSGTSIWIGGLKSNTGRGEFLSGEPLVPRNRVRGAMFKVEVETGAEELARRIDTNDADSVSGIAFSPSGRYAYGLHQGAGTLSVYDLAGATRFVGGDGSTIPFEARIDVGHAPQGIVVSADGTRAWVANYLSRDLTVLDLGDPRAPAVAATVPLTAEPLDAAVANGKRLSFRSREPRHSEGNYIACASCHADGGMSDGRTWDFTQSGEGLRNTIDLRGRAGLGHGPVHWSANFDEIQDFENDIVNSFGGTGLAGDGDPPNPPLGHLPNAGRSADLDDLAAYVTSLADTPRSPHRLAGGRASESAERGRELFFDETVGCAGCHLRPTFTDSRFGDPSDYVLHEVGTLGEGSGGRLGGPLLGLDTPTLLGVWATPPYLHDGSTATLRDVVKTRNEDDRHGTTSHLADAQVDDLVAFLLVLDDLEAGGAGLEVDSGCGCVIGTAPKSGWPWVLLIYIVIVRRRR